MSKPIFMSAEHIALMNRLLADDAASKAACAALDRDYRIVYELIRDGKTVWWTMEYMRDTGVRFHLAPIDGAPDVTFRGEYWATLEATRRAKAGQSTEMPLMMSGEPGVMEAIGPAFAAARTAATIDTEIPKPATNDQLQ